jgi:Uma2 family endonuclease
MATPIGQTEKWTAVDLAESFGPIPLARIRTNPPPGQASEQDVIAIHDHEDRLCELVDGVLVEKTVGAYESYLAILLARHLGNFVEAQRLGIVLGSDGMMRLAPGLVRIPDVSFISFDRLPNRQVPRDAIAKLAPDLAVEIISKGNTRQEMDRKLRDYFAGGVRLVWYVYPTERAVRIYTAAERSATIREPESLDGGDVVPGFILPLGALFAEPEPKRG